MHRCRDLLQVFDGFLHGVSVLFPFFCGLLIAGFHCQNEASGVSSHSRVNQWIGALASKTLSMPAVRSDFASSHAKKVKFALNGHGPPRCFITPSKISAISQVLLTRLEIRNSAKVRLARNLSSKLS